MVPVVLDVIKDIIIANVVMPFKRNQEQVAVAEVQEPIGVLLQVVRLTHDSMEGIINRLLVAPMAEEADLLLNVICMEATALKLFVVEVVQFVSYGLDKSGHSHQLVLDHHKKF